MFFLHLKHGNLAFMVSLIKFVFFFPVQSRRLNTWCKSFHFSFYLPASYLFFSFSLSSSSSSASSMLYKNPRCESAFPRLLIFICYCLHLHTCISACNIDTRESSVENALHTKPHMRFIHLYCFARFIGIFHYLTPW